MIKTFKCLAVLIITITWATISAAENVVPIKTIAVVDGIHMLMGRGGNLAVSTGVDGTFLVDDQYAPQYTGITDAIAKLSDNPVKFLINTHWHGDHTGGNEQMGKANAIIVAQENVRQRMGTDQVVEFFNSKRPASPIAALPIVTFSKDITFHLNGNEINVFHVLNAHTDGDAVIHFKQANVIHTGDIFSSEYYPFIDSGSGGSVRGTIKGVERILAISDDKTRVIPGHGKISDRKGVEEYLAMLNSVHKAVAGLIVAGNSVEQTVLAKPTAAFDAKWGGGFLKPDVFVRIVYESIKRSTLD
ncbi:MAG TPA: MBL fold metallo-hydrolase [Gammaproteobacteria bacterium]|nr:MBL fold metallo-hydrolase [Gammaproteobacteria bacterium]